MLQSGKSATMLPSITTSSSGHWNHEDRADGSAPRARHRGAPKRARRRGRDSARPRPSRGSPAGVRARLDRAVRQPLQICLDQRQALLDLLDANPDAGIDIAGVARRHSKDSSPGRIAKRLACVEGAAAGASDIKPPAPNWRAWSVAQNAGLRGGPAARWCCRRVRRAAETRAALRPAGRSRPPFRRRQDLAQRRPAPRNPSSGDGRSRHRWRAACARAGCRIAHA